MVKECVFYRYSRKLVFSEREKLKKEKKTLIERFHKGLDAFANGNIVHTRKLSREAKLLEKRVAQLDEHVEKIGKTFEFERSFKLILVVSFILAACSLWLWSIVD